MARRGVTIEAERENSSGIGVLMVFDMHREFWQYYNDNLLGDKEKPLNASGGKTYIEDIREGEEVVSVFLGDEIRLGQTRGGKPFVGLKLKDRTGRMEARVWDEAEAFFNTFKNGDVLRVRAAAESFQGQTQLKILKAQPVDPAEVDPADFVAASPFDVDTMFADLADTVAHIQNADLRGLMEDILNDPGLAGPLKKAPAAKRFHHAYAGGLLEHTLAVAKSAVALGALYPVLNTDLLVVGAMIHDLGKIREFQLGLAGDYTDEGRLLGHLVLGVEMLEEKLAGRPDFPAELGLLLKHLIVSHHGEYELGSPKKPKILEALALHHLDDLDAKMNGIGGFVARHADEETGWTDYNRLMERFFYRPRWPADSDGNEPVEATDSVESVDVESVEMVQPDSAETNDEPHEFCGPTNPNQLSLLDA